MERCLWRLGLYEKELDEETIAYNKNKFKLKESTMLYPIQETEKKLSLKNTETMVNRLYTVKKYNTAHNNVHLATGLQPLVTLPLVEPRSHQGARKKAAETQPPNQAQAQQELPQEKDVTVIHRQ